MKQPVRIKFVGGEADGDVESYAEAPAVIHVATAGRGAANYVIGRTADGRVIVDDGDLVYLPRHHG